MAIVGVPVRRRGQLPARARFGPAHVRESSRLLRPYNPALDVSPFARAAGRRRRDLAVNPFDIEEAIGAVEARRRALLERAGRLVTIGGDHTIALPLLRAVARAARAGRRRALRRPPRHLGHLLRGGVHPRDAVPPGVRGGPDRPRGVHARRHPRPAVRRPATCPTTPRSASRSCSAGAGGPRLARRHRADPGPGRRPAGLRVGRHRRARPGLRPGHRHARGGRPDSAGSCWRAARLRRR